MAVFKKFRPPLSCDQQLQQQEREATSRLGVLPSFSPISLHNLLHATSDVIWFLLLRLPIVGFALWGVVFCLDSGPFFFFFPCSLELVFPLFA
jgi:hypothetical protein